MADEKDGAPDPLARFKNEAGELMEEFTLPLRKPITKGDSDAINITELKLHAPNGEEVDVFEKAARRSARGEISDVQANCELLSKQTNIGVKILLKLDARDIFDSMSYITAFFDDGPQTGGKSAPG